MNKLVEVCVGGVVLLLCVFIFFYEPEATQTSVSEAPQSLMLASSGDNRLARALTGSETVVDALSDTAEQHAAKHADPNYICPMHPQVQQGEPGGCPICGMDLVLKDTNASAGDGLPVVNVSANTAQSMGVRTGKVKKRNLSRSIKTVGHIRYDEDNLYHLSPGVAGRVRNPAVLAIGDTVEAGQELASYYSQAMYAAQEDYLQALRSSGSQQQTKALDRLRGLDIPEGVIQTLEQEGRITANVPMVAPISGVMTRINAQEGAYLGSADVMYSMGDLSNVWVIADIFPEQANWVQKGARATLTVDALPDQKWTGQVEHIYPEVNLKTRTMQVRLEFDNTDGLLKPNMFANVKITNRPVTGVLAIPREALIPAADGYRVVKVTEDNHYKPVDVKVGTRTDKAVEIIEGLDAGDEIVLSGQFLIDSESNLQASFQRMSH